MKGKRNRGSSAIEFSLLVPILFGCIYFYIMLFLFFICSGKKVDQMTEAMYRSEQNPDGDSRQYPEGIRVQMQGKTEKVSVEEQDGMFDFRMEMRKDTEDPVENIRRWQFVTDLF